jgi:hypothetical protein
MKSLLKSPRVSKQVLLLILATGVCVALAVVGGILAIFTPVIFDNGNLKNPVAWLGFLFAALFWVVCLLSPLSGWILWRKGERQHAWAAMAMPLAWGMATLTLLQFVSK